MQLTLEISAAPHFGEFSRAVSPRVRAISSGIWSDYAFKCALDVLNMSGHVPDGHLSDWPMECTGYITGLADLFKVKISKTHLFEAMCFIFREMAVHHGGKLCFAEVSMQLCWNLRRRQGRLSDTDP